jgi:hypothetical protein
MAEAQFYKTINFDVERTNRAASKTELPTKANVFRYPLFHLFRADRKAHEMRLLRYDGQSPWESEGNKGSRGPAPSDRLHVDFYLCKSWFSNIDGLTPSDRPSQDLSPENGSKSARRF